MFKSARIKLTAWYLVIILLITGSLSVLFYRGTSLVLEGQFERIEHRLEMREKGFGLPPGPRLLPADLEAARKEIAHQLFILNAVIGLIFGVAGYMFAGKTLRPIEEAMEKQKRFIADASHELKTPLTVLKTAMEVDLRDKKISSRTKSILVENLKEVDSLNNLINSLLKLARRIEKGEIAFQEISLNDIVDKATRYITPLAKRKKITIRIKVTPKRAIVLGEESSLVELLATLLDNSVKYTPKGGKIGVKVISRKSGLLLSVKDNGAGIKNEHLDHIFDRFYRVDQSRSKSIADGFGLGLSLVKEVVAQYGGSIIVKSNIGKGTVFTIKLPLKQA